MKFKHLTIIGLCSIALLLVVVTGSAKAVDISFDGYNDGLTININEDLSVWGSYNGSRSSATSGNVNYALQPDIAPSITVCPNETTEVPTGWVYTVNISDHTWCLYQSGILWGCGTWSFGVPAMAAGAGATGE